MPLNSSCETLVTQSDFDAYFCDFSGSLFVNDHACDCRHFWMWKNTFYFDCDARRPDNDTVGDWCFTYGKCSLNQNRTWKYCNTSLAAPAGRNFFKDELDIAITSIVDGIFTQLVFRSKDPFSREAGCRSIVKWSTFGPGTMGATLAVGSNNTTKLSECANTTLPNINIQTIAVNT